jgi:hypothetical protein
MPEFRRPHHQVISSILNRFNAQLLSEAHCFFGGGTQLAMTYGEYRESRDVDFLCSSREGFRLLRQEVTNESLGQIVSQPVTFAREVRADRDGIRTFLEADGLRIKFELIHEARIDLEGEIDRRFAVPSLSVESAIGEKFLANADRGRDESTASRDLIDLAFVVTHVEKDRFQAGFEIAEKAYGDSVERELRHALDAFRDGRARANECIKTLAVEDTATLRKGLRLLRNAV